MLKMHHNANISTITFIEEKKLQLTTNRNNNNNSGKRNMNMNKIYFFIEPSQLLIN
jgi:hypothetical protein